MKRFLLIVLTAVAMQPALVLAESSTRVHSTTTTTTVKQETSSNEDSAKKVARFKTWMKAKAKNAGTKMKSAKDKFVNGCRRAKNKVFRKVKTA